MAAGRHAPPGRGQLLRHRRHQRPRRAGRALRRPAGGRRAAAPALAAAAALGETATALDAATANLADHLEQDRMSSWRTWPSRSRPAAAPWRTGGCWSARAGRRRGGPARARSGAGPHPASPEAAPARRLPVPRPGRAVGGHGSGPLRPESRSSARCGPLRRAAPARAGRRPAGAARQGRRAHGPRPAGPVRRRVRPGAAVDGLGRPAAGDDRPHDRRVRGGLPGRRVLAGGRPPAGGRPRPADAGACRRGPCWPSPCRRRSCGRFSRARRGPGDRRRQRPRGLRGRPAQPTPSRRCGPAWRSGASTAAASTPRTPSTRG